MITFGSQVSCTNVPVFQTTENIVPTPNFQGNKFPHSFKVPEEGFSDVADSTGNFFTKMAPNRRLAYKGEHDWASDRSNFRISRESDIGIDSTLQ